MIIHISGPSGSGKSTLGRRLSKLKNTVVLDTDDIDDPIKLKAMEKYMPDTKAEWKRVDKFIATNNREELEIFIEKNKNKNIIFVGFYHNGMAFLDKLVDKKFSIKINPETLWQQYNLRTLDAIHKNYTMIKKIFSRDDLSIVLRHRLVSNKFGIRNGFECKGLDGFKAIVETHKQKDTKKGYIYKTPDEIFNAIKK